MTNIPYLDEVWNLTRGCTKVSAGCAHCYAERITQRFWRGPKGMSFNGAIDVSTVEKALDKPLHWRKPRRIGVCFMSDLFHEKVPDEFIARVWGCMNTLRTSRHTFLILTKRPERMCSLLSSEDFENRAFALIPGGTPFGTVAWPLPNVWLGVSVENQETADERIPILLETPAAHRWVSAEPLLGAVDLHSFLPCGDPVCEEELTFLNWVVVGGESGPHSRQMEPYWLAQGILDCQAAGVPVYCKQDSGPRPGMQGRISDALWAVKQLPGGWA